MISLYKIIIIFHIKKKDHILLSISYLCAVSATLLPARELPHYFILLLPFIILSLSAIEPIFADKRHLFILVATAIFVYLGIHTYRHYLSKTPEEISIQKYQANWFPGDRLIGRKLKELGFTNMSAYTDRSHTGILFYSGNRPAMKYLTTWNVSMGIVTPAAYYALLQEGRPKLCIINDQNILREFTGTWIDDNYRLFLIIGNTNIFVRKCTKGNQVFENSL